MENIYSLGELIAEQHKRRIEAAERVTAILQWPKCRMKRDSIII
ncbi:MULTISPECIES: hypothetical protein [Paenibacillus]|jgi:hypothetical protein|uniref:Uncharacterized protein n=1 Tax=Paenibacillus peoriae TaxID=59893 RepID=A0ABU1Q8A9_9BACL|nr:MULTISPECIES: hypothetical protein [Paenibacillus]MDR6775861.1 hypothetical protein [Paenibacillus peoriae]